jgi:hypothetical protein
VGHVAIRRNRIACRLLKENVKKKEEYIRPKLG